MPTKEGIKRELDFAKNMAEILDVMKQLAQSQFTKAKKVCTVMFGGHLLSFDPVFRSMLSLKGDSPFIRCQSDTVGIIVTTSDQSFMASLNSKIVKGAKEAAGDRKVQYLVTGRKGAIKMRFNNDPYVGFPAVKEGPSLRALSNDMMEYIVTQVKEKKLGRIYITSAISKSFSSQEIVAVQLLPFSELVPENLRGVLEKNPEKIIQESSTEVIAEFTAKHWLYNQLFYRFQNNKPAEFGALATQMEGSHDNVKKVIGKLNIAYKRARNEKIDAGMREVFVATMVSGG